MTLHEAPSREDNWCGPRDFAYLAEVDILGWKFRKMADGTFVVDTPKVTLDDAGRGLTASFGRGHTALIEALMALEHGGEPDVPDSWDSVGKVVQA